MSAVTTATKTGHNNIPTDNAYTNDKKNGIRSARFSVGDRDFVVAFVLYLVQTYL